MPGVVEGDSASSAAAAQRAKGLWFGYQLIAVEPYLWLTLLSLPRIVFLVDVG
jgi:hypothetical protein